MLAIGRRKYTQLRQLLPPSEINFPEYHRIVDHRTDIIMRSSLCLYLNPTTPIGACVSYSGYVEHTFKTIMPTIFSPSPQYFALTFQIADGLDQRFSTGGHEHRPSPGGHV